MYDGGGGWSNAPPWILQRDGALLLSEVGGCLYFGHQNVRKDVSVYSTLLTAALKKEPITSLQVVSRFSFKV